MITIKLITAIARIITITTIRILLQLIIMSGRPSLLLAVICLNIYKSIELSACVLCLDWFSFSPNYLKIVSFYRSLKNLWVSLVTRVMDHRIARPRICCRLNSSANSLQLKKKSVKILLPSLLLLSPLTIAIVYVERFDIETIKS